LHLTNAKLKLIGLSAPEFANIYPEYRIEKERLGCVASNLKSNF